MKRPSFQFYPSDWRKDPALSSCSLAARGLWIALMCIAHESDDYGVLSLNGKPLTDVQLARMVGESPALVKRLIAELEGAGVFSRNAGGCIFSRRMVKDERIRNVRADAGRLGGNPNLLKQKVKQTGKQTPEQKPTPSSSSSSLIPIPSEPNGSGSATPPPPGPAEVIFGFGVPMLVSAGTPERQARSFLGALRKRTGNDQAVADALQRCATEKPLQPIEWLAAALPAGAQMRAARPSKHTGFSNFNYREGVTADGALA